MSDDINKIMKRKKKLFIMINHKIKTKFKDKESKEKRKT